MKRTVRLITSWDDTCIQNYEIAGLITEYHIPTIFFLQANEIGLSQASNIPAIGGTWITIGSHSISHPADIKRLDDQTLQAEVEVSKRVLEQAVEKPVRFFCYPKGKHDYRVREAVRTAGYTYARTTEVFRTGHTDPLQAGTTIHCYPRKEYRGRDWSDFARDQVAAMAGQAMGYVHIWGHGWEIEKHGDWHKLRELFRWIRDNYAIQDIRSEL